MWRYESDGGGWGNVWQPKTHYVTDGLETRIDCTSAVQARRMAKKLNEGFNPRTVRCDRLKIIQEEGRVKNNKGELCTSTP